jgi:hypothetical protein
MYRVPVQLPGPLRIYISAPGFNKISEQQQRFSYLPDANRLVTDLIKLGSQGGIPAILYQRKKDEPYPELQLYTNRHYYIVLHLMKQSHEGYAFGYIEPLGLREQERMSKGVLLLQAPYWSWCPNAYDLRGFHSSWTTIVNAWGSLESWRKQARTASTEHGEARLTADQENYLTKIQTLVDIEHKLEQDQNQFPQQVLYHKVASTGEKRYARDIYTFLLHGSPTINEKNMLRIVEERGLQARVLSYKKNRLTLKFERAIDLDRIPPSGTFEPIVSGAIYRTQQEALETLRTGEAKNPHLLHALVDQRFQNYTPGTQVPEQNLNAAQREAFQRAQTLPDLLLVWGPPGTGKSRTITEIARQYSKQGRRVLITSGTHKAVDNVLEQFLTDEHLMVVRFGHEDRILETVRARLTIDEQTRAMQQQILKRTQPLTQQLQTFTQERNTLHNQVLQAQNLLSQWQSNQQRLQELQQLLEYARQKIESQYQPQMQQLAFSLQRLETLFQKQTQQIALWRQKQEQAAQKVGQTILSFFYRWRIDYFQKRLVRLYPLITKVQQNQLAVRQEHQVVQQQLQEALKSNPEYRQYANTITTLSTQSTRFLEQVQSYAQVLAQQTSGLLPRFVGALTGVDLQRYLSQATTSFTLLEQRATLLRNWQNELETSAEQLTPEVLRYADIVGATCIGVATAKGLADIDFDLVIVDEAGQISTPNLLVPLVRARRAILVGDHMQLPPFVDSSVKTWIENLSPQALQDLGVEYEDFEQNQLLSALTRSAFEQLLLTRPRHDNLVAFTEQRRMPRVIADFASRHFYGQQLTTVRNEQSSVRGTLFQSELMFVDTSTLDGKVRQDSKREKTEDWESPGFINQCEARLIARLAAHYEQNKAEWAIIVPYRAQASLIISYLEKLVEAPDFRWDERVATVDSFQGGERDYILYSFTRSNTYGKIGFLNELRRFNVALTRAKQQLVLVGDLSTLTHAEDPDFCALLQSLQNYVQVHGELLTYQECQRRLG